MVLSVKRNLLCWLLIFLMAVGLMPFGAFASDAPGLSDAFIDPVTEWNQYDHLIRSCQTTLDTAKRAEMLHQAEDLLMSTGCVIPLYYFGINYLLKTNYQNVFVDNGGACCRACK